MDSVLPKEDSQLKRSIYTEIRRKAFEHKALIPKNINIHRRSTQHTRIEKSFEDAYNSSPRSRVLKMKAARKIPEKVVSYLFIAESSDCMKARKRMIFENNSINCEVFLKMSNLCEKERVKTHKILNKMNEFRKHVDDDLMLIEGIKEKLGGEMKRMTRPSTGRKLKENVI